MRPLPSRPWIEATALLASAGVVLPPPGPDRHPFIRSLIMQRTADGLPAYAFAERLDDATKARVFPHLKRLADHIESRRFGQALELVEVQDLEIPGRPGLHRGVQVFTLDLSQSRDRCIGWAWLNGQGRDVLQPALFDARRAAAPARRSHATSRLGFKR